jgi:hypothetical protein
VKTPREILLQHHHSAQPKLDAIRKTVIEKETQPAGTHTSWREILRSLRWHLAGMSAVWLLVLILRADSSPAPQLAISIPARIPPRVVIASVREHRRLLSEMTEAHPPDREPRELFLPKPRSDRHAEILIT